jgi:Zn-dependent M28 family amino/carboxypeptidase
MSKASQLCGDYLINFMKQYADTVYVQTFSSKLWDGTNVEGRNIIASFNPQASDRVVLAAHWDSRLWADEDPNEENHKKAIDGANDGASGVGVLMEIARVFRQKENPQGVDIVFFDLEDQGTPSWAESDVEDQSDWCLGSQHWSKTPHYPFYTANYGILLDMVGYKNLRFTKEGLSMHYAASIMNKVWEIAAAKGYSNIFINEQTYPIMDDHHWVNLTARIPMIDIVQNDPTCSFFPFWHTMQDNMDNISKESLKIVGDVCLTTIFSNQ